MSELTAALAGEWPVPVRPSLPVRLAAARAEFWRQLAYETRRHAGDDRLPPSQRERLREATRASTARAAAAEPRPALQFPRRWLRDHASASLTSEQPLAAVSVERAFDVCEPGLAFLRDEGYRIVRLGAGAEPDGLVLQSARVVVCDSLAVQRAAALANRPSLLLGATDVFAGYPVLGHGLYLLRRAVDLDSGRDIPLAERLTEGYYRNLRNCGFRRAAASDILDAVRELHEGLRDGWRDSDAQARFRTRATEAGVTLSSRVASVAEWGPDDGFLGDGRLARCQANELT